MRRKLMTRLWLLCSIGLLSACAAPRSPSPPRLAIPVALLRCPPAPTVPDSEATQRDAALYVLDLAHAHSVCRDRLGRVRALLDAAR